MDIFKNIIIGILISTTAFIGLYHLYVDDELSPDARKWIEYYSKSTNLTGNAFIELIALSSDNTISTSQAKTLYKTKLGEIKNGFLEHSQQLKYPNVDGLPDIYGDDEVYFCEFNNDNCLYETPENRAAIEKVLSKFSLITQQYRALSKLTNFSPLNSIATSPDWDQLATIHRLVILTVYFHILDNNLEKAATQLSQLMTIDRHLLRTASDAIFHVTPIVNFKLYYQPMLVRLKHEGFTRWEMFEDSLKPLTHDDLSMNRMWLRSFAQDTRAIQFKYIVGKGESINFFDTFQAKLKYKENMTFNSMFEHYNLQLIPDNAKKEELIALVEIAEKAATNSYEEQRNDLNNMFMFNIKNYKNIVGAYLELTASPKFLSLYENKFELDLRLMLLNIMIHQDETPLEEIITLKQNKNPYTGEAPKLSGSQLCYQIVETETCINVKRTTKA